jgi:aldehyde dehydrogenase (NAD+)
MPELPEYRNLIGGQSRPPAAGRYLESVNPATGQAWARVPASDRTDVDAAVAAAREAFPAWSALTAHQRSGYLRKVAAVFATHGQELAELETRDNGRVFRENIERCWHGQEFMWNQAAGKTLEAVTGRTVTLGPATQGLTMREPYGVVAAIIPWNAPIAMLTAKASLALAAGNTVVVKPAEQACVSVLRLGELLADVLPPGVLNIVSGLGPEAGEPLVRHPAVSKVSMTGSTQTGKAIARAAADTLTPAIFELGGKSPNIIFSDADLDAAALGTTVSSVFSGNAGQVCVAGSRVLIQRPVLEEMLQRMEAIAATVVTGDPFDPATTMGPIVSRAQYERVVGFLESGAKEADLVFGGRHGEDVVPALPGGYWVEPTVFMAGDNSPRICREEIFGPVAVVIGFDTDEEALAIANDTSYGLAAGLWTRDLARAHRFVRDLQAGNVWVNIYRQTGSELPFGGIKDSGYGHDAIDEYTREKSAVIAT